MKWLFGGAPRRAPEGTRALTALAPGASATIVRVASADPGRLVKLSSIGLMAGVRVVLLQRRPAVLVKVAETSIALDRAVADEILVDPEPGFVTD